MKKCILITIILFLATTILQILLQTIINEQILSRILFGVDYDTYFMNYYSGQAGFVALISGDKMPYDWFFTLSKYIIVILCIVAIFFTIKKLRSKYNVNKKDFIIIMILFSILSLYEVISYIAMFYKVPPFKLFVLPILFISFVYICIYKMLYLKANK